VMGAANMLANITRNWGAFRAMLAMPVAEILTCSCLNWVWTIASDNHAYRDQSCRPRAMQLSAIQFQRWAALIPKFSNSSLPQVRKTPSVLTRVI
jgi:hypothetical protein